MDETENYLHNVSMEFAPVLQELIDNHEPVPEHTIIELTTGISYRMFVSDDSYPPLEFARLLASTLTQDMLLQILPES